jgi:hypothetical protein
LRTLKEGEQSIATREDALPKLFEGFQGVEAERSLLGQHAVDGRRIGVHGGVLLGHRQGKAPAIGVVELHVDDAQSGAPHHPVNLPQRIVCDVLVAGGVKRVRLQHRRQIALLQMPDAVVGEDGHDIVHECLRLLQVVDHRDGGDDLRLAAIEELAKHFCREEVHDQLDIGPVIFRELTRARIDADERRTVHRIARQQRSVVAADVEYEIVRPDRH